MRPYARLQFIVSFTCALFMVSNKNKQLFFKIQMEI